MKIDVNHLNSNNMTPIHTAAKKNQKTSILHAIKHN